MAQVIISVRTGAGDVFEVTREYVELNSEAYGSDKTYLDNLVSGAAEAVKRAYWPESKEPGGEE